MKNHARTGGDPPEADDTGILGAGPVHRALFVVNRSSATGRGKMAVEKLYATLDELMGRQTRLQLAVVDQHPQARRQVEAFLAESDAPALIISGGGGGTLRAVVEGVCQGTVRDNLPPSERIRMATLRMGSGNIVAKQLGIPRDPDAALRGIVANLRQDRATPCCIIRCEAGRKDSPPAVLFATAMAGFGQFGRCPGDLARWHRRLPALRRVIARVIGIERLNTIEYGLSFSLRLLRSALAPASCEVVDVHFGQSLKSMRLLSAAIMNFPVKQLPFEPAVRIEEAVLSLHAVPYPGRCGALLGLLSMKRLSTRAWEAKIGPPGRLELRLIDRDTAEFFLDEDPVSFYQTVRIEVAGTLAFVPGPDYRWPDTRRDSR